MARHAERWEIAGMTVQARRLVKWLIIAALAAMASYLAFRGYLMPDLLLNFANSFYC